VPDKRRHRGPHPEDPVLFAPDQLLHLRAAVAELSWMLGRAYAEKSALKLVGDHHQLAERQRRAVMRAACPDTLRLPRLARQISPQDVAAHRLAIDGYNVLTSVEAALAGGALFLGRDGCLRDVASMHGSFRRVAETVPAILTVGQFLDRCAPGNVLWYLDKPVGNSGRLKKVILELAATHSWPWTVELVPSPDPELAASPGVVATADSIILDRCQRWLNLARHVVATMVPTAWVIDLGDELGPA
jgi:hypothetical protein